MCSRCDNAKWDRGRAAMVQEGLDPNAMTERDKRQFMIRFADKYPWLAGREITVNHPRESRPVQIRPDPVESLTVAVSELVANLEEGRPAKMREYPTRTAQEFRQYQEPARTAPKVSSPAPAPSQGGGGFVLDDSA